MTNAHILYAVDPRDLKRQVEVRIEFDTFNRWFKRFYQTRGQNLRTAKEVLLHPTRIYVGLKRPFDQEGWCYVGKPNQWYIKETLVPFPENLVYAVYLNDRRSVFDHYPEDADASDSLSMHDWENRFGDIIRVRS